jgi:hypothetical protein
MSIDSVLNEHKVWLDKATTVLASNKPAAADLAAPLVVKQQLIQTLAARVEDLTGQKEAAIKQYDAAIAEAKGQQARLQQELTVNQALLQPITGAVRQPTLPTDVRTVGVAPGKGRRAERKRRQPK